MNFVLSINILFFLYLIYQVITKSNKILPLFELTGALYILQCYIAPWIEYTLFESHSMAVSSEELLYFTGLSNICFVIGLLSIKQYQKINTQEISPEKASKIGRVLVLIGLLTQAVLVIPSLQVLHSLLNFILVFKYVGAFALVYSNKRFDKFLIATVYIILLISVIRDAMMIEMIIYGLFLFLFLSLRYKFSIKKKILGLLCTILIVSLFQSIKEDYRNKTWTENVSSDNKLKLLNGLINKQIEKEKKTTRLIESKTFQKTIIRLNQGWQISLAMRHVPKKEPFSKGSDFMNDIWSSFIPRFIFPNKRSVNSQERFKKYTGYNLNESTAMSIGVFGDFYVNFGLTGSFVGLFLLGRIMALLLKWLMNKFVEQNFLNLIWIPFIFTYFIRPNNEFYMMFNNIIKSIIILYVITSILYPLILNKNASKIG